VLIFPSAFISEISGKMFWVLPLADCYLLIGFSAHYDSPRTDRVCQW
jgi:hypothetical protein